MRTNLLFIFCVALTQCFASYPSDEHDKTVVITGKIKSLNVQLPTDTVILEIWDRPIGGIYGEGRSKVYYQESEDFHPRLYKTVIKNGSFSFSVPQVNKPLYCSLGLGRRSNGTLFEIFKYYLIEPGDNIQLSIDSIIKEPRGDAGVKNIQFFGRGSEKFTFKRNLYEKNNDFARKHPNYQVDLRGVASVAYNDSIYWEALVKDIYYKNEEAKVIPLTELKKFKGKLSPVSYSILYLDELLTGQSIVDITYSITKRYLDSAKGDFNKKSIKRVLDSMYFSHRMSYAGVSENAKALSIRYANYVVDSIALLFHTKDSQTRYDFIKANYSDLVRDRIIVEFYNRKVSAGLSEVDIKNVSDALLFVSDFTYSTYLAKLKSRSLVGKAFYNFELPDVNDKYYKLADFKGKTIFMDFWYKNCGACEVFSKNVLRPLEKELRGDTTVVFVTVCIDKKGDFSKGTGFVSSLASGVYTDPAAENVINLYTDNKGKQHPIILENMIYAYPYPLIIDKYGILRRVGDIPRTREGIKEILDKVSSIQMTN